MKYNIYILVVVIFSLGCEKENKSQIKKKGPQEVFFKAPVEFKSDSEQPIVAQQDGAYKFSISKTYIFPIEVKVGGKNILLTDKEEIEECTLSLEVDSGDKITFLEKNIITAPIQGYKVNFNAGPTTTTIGSKGTVTIKFKFKADKNNSSEPNIAKRKIEIVA